MDRRAKNKPVKTITVASGKGGVGKTNVVANLAIALSKMGNQVLVFDADLGLSNIDVILDLAPKYNIQHVLKGEKSLAEVIVEGPHGIKILPAASGVQEVTAIDEFQRMSILEEFDALSLDIDYLIVDSAAGISSNVAFFCVASQEIIILASPEPTSLTDAYALMKVLFTRYQEKNFKVLVNAARSEPEAKDVFRKLSMVVEKFLNISIDYLGYIPYDDAVRKAVRQQKAFVDAYPGSKASLGIQALARKIDNDKENKVKGSLQFFLGTLLGSKITN